ncbi:epoxide hydrolase family protein [Aquisediminimonas sediminicola]|uniref:epoxide hydrolase family protein n=1 Tax=Alteraquisediminimonas sediminicola TaxID=2676787 RepID=UPI001C8CF3EA|nr:epoxide hydrolase family protein [Aquisediminimonas sediminicola]
MSDIRPFIAPATDQAILDLRRRLEGARWPDRETVTDSAQGPQLDKMQRIADHWQHRHDWQACARWLENAGQFITEIDGLDIHFLHIRSHHEHALPLLLTHGWPGAILEFRHVIAPLIDPENHGGTADDAFHLVIPSLPGFGYSGKPAAPGWGVKRIAAAWEVLMARLGYDHYVAQGGDWGATITTTLGMRRAPALAAIHINMPLVLPDDLSGPLSSEEQAMLDAMMAYQAHESGYSTQQATRPQTIGYALADSPIGQLAWIYEKFANWADCGGDPETVIALDDMLDIVTLYWLTNSAASSARIYWESFADGFGARQLDLPVGCSIFPGELYRAPRSWAERCMSNIIHWRELPRGGHFAALEQPSLFVGEMRDCFRSIR